MEAIDLNKIREEKLDIREPKDGDGDGGGIIMVESVVIIKADNGYIITTTYEDDSQSQEVFDVTGLDDGHKQMLNAVMDSFGLNPFYEIKEEKFDI